MRRRVKAMSYGLAYGLSVFGLSQQLRIPTEEAREQMEAYFARFGGVRDYLHEVVEKARQGRLHRDRPRPPPLPAGPHLPTTASAARWPSAWHSTPPSRAAPPTSSRSPCSGVYRALEESGLRSRMLLQVHDELVLEVAEGEREAVEALVRDAHGQRLPPRRAAGGLGRRRPLLGRRRPLSSAELVGPGVVHAVVLRRSYGADPDSRVEPEHRWCAGARRARRNGRDHQCRSPRRSLERMRVSWCRPCATRSAGDLPRLGLSADDVGSQLRTTSPQPTTAVDASLGDAPQASTKGDGAIYKLMQRVHEESVFGRRSVDDAVRQFFSDASSPTHLLRRGAGAGLVVLTERVVPASVQAVAEGAPPRRPVNRRSGVRS